MKKFTLLLLVLTGWVCTANATKLYVNTSTNVNWWTNVRIYAYNSESDNNGWNYSETGVVSTTETYFGKDWYVFDMGNYKNAIVQYYESSDHRITNKSTSITDIENDRFIFIPGSSSGTEDNVRVWTWYENGYTFRSNVLDNWGETTCNMTVVNNNTLSYTLSKSTITSSRVDKIWFRLLDQEGQLYPTAEGTTLSFGDGTSTYYNNWTETSWSFGINIPSYDYEKIVVKATLSGETWTISADAYISKTVIKEYKYATLGCSDALDLSGLAAKGITAYPLTVASVGSITKGTAITTVLAANKGVLLEIADDAEADSDGKITFTLPVSAAVAASGSNNMVATSGTHVNQGTVEGYTNYILAKEGNSIGFYKVNSTSGNDMGANTAYLQVANGYVPSGARDFFLLEDESGTTDIHTVNGSGVMANDYFNLAGQRVAQPTKALYIVNGKKYLVK